MSQRIFHYLIFFTLILWGSQPELTPAQNRRTAVAANQKRPKLILQITVDQLRGDEPFRYRDRFGGSGFRYLMDHGTWYLAAYQAHAHTETVVGHTTLATGAYPSRHGMIGNWMFDRKRGELVDCTTTDELTTIIGTTKAGASPGRILTTTFGDELIMTTAGKAKVFSVSIKDRGAVTMAGHSGKAFWFSTESGTFVSSTYYYPQYPNWVAEANGRISNIAHSYDGKSWTQLFEPATYLFRNVPPFGVDVFGYGKTFPHPYGNPADYTRLTVSPVGDELTVDFAEKLIEGESLGSDAVPDYLAISFSANDLIGHTFGPSSLENEDGLLRLDRTLASLFSFIDRRIGLENTLIVLAGDHGAPEVPEFLEYFHVNSGRLTDSDIRDQAAAALRERFADGDKLILEYKHPDFYLNHALIEERKLDQIEVERIIARAVMSMKGIAVAISCSELSRGGEEADPEMINQIRRTLYPGRSGDVYVVQEPGWQVEGKRATGEPAVAVIDHGSPWTYDTYVPVAFAGMKVPAAQVSRHIYTVDVAATLAAYLRTNQPSGSVGAPLIEVLAHASRQAGRLKRVKERDHP